METVNLSFRYTPTDYAKALRLHYAARLRWRLDIAVIVLVAVLGVYELRSGSIGFGIVCLAVSGLFALMLLAVFLVFPVIAFRTQPKLRDEYALTFSPQGIHFRTAHISSELQWTLYTRALVDANSFLLYYGGSRDCTIIPRRAFQDDAQLQAFERMLSQNISNVADRTR